jgi:ketosteroid isomerase-like protein
MSSATALKPAQDDIRTLEDLNRNYVRAAQEADLRWYEQNLAEDFVSGNPDGSFADKAGFLARIARGAAGTEYAAENVRVHRVGDVALIHAGFRYRRPDGRLHLGSYTDTWALRDGRWLCVGAQFQLFANDHETLSFLNGEYIRAVRESDVAWFDAHLAADFLNSNPDGTLVDKAAFLKQIAPPCAVINLQCEEVRIRSFGDFVQIHARTTYGKPDGSKGAGRYTDTWLRREGRWVCISAQVTRS